MTAGGTAVRRSVAIVLIAAGGVFAWVGLRGDDAPAATPARLATPLWSPRRVPQPVVDAVGAQRLQARLDAELGTNQACAVVADGSGVVAARNPDAALAPASTQKLLTGLAAIRALGSDFTYETKVVAPAAAANGRVERLWLVGSGDPLLSTPDYPTTVESNPRRNTEEQATGPSRATTPLAAIADAIVGAGVHDVPGGIQGDDSRYDATRYVPSWPTSYRTDPEVGPVGALTVNHGMRVIQPTMAPTDDPAVLAATALGDLLRARGVSVGPPGRSTAPDGSKPVASVRSAPLHDIVSASLEASDNLAMEMLAREVGVKVASQGTTAAGTKAIVDTIRELGVPVDGVALVDGSGLDRGNRVSCQALMGALAFGARPAFKGLWDGLPVAGRTGTLADELRGSSLEGKLRAKTGSLQGVTGLAGFVDVNRHVTFSYLASGGFNLGGGVAMRERVAQIIGQFPDAPPADQLVPAPSPPAPPPSG